MHKVECHGCSVVLEFFANAFVSRVKRRIDIPAGAATPTATESLAVGSAEHESIVAAAICGKLDQHREVQSALCETGSARPAFPLTFSYEPGALARVTPLTLMID
jgi:hypothetical protein